MAEKVDMSLDDIIALSKKRRGGGGGRGRGGSRGRGGGGGGGGPRRGGSAPRNIRGGGGRGGGRVQKRRSGSFGRSRLSDDTVWEHDMYDGGRSKPQIGRQYNAGGNAETRLMVSNLDFAVNDNDIYELFAECGPLKRGTVNYDRSGRSLGTAEVVFERRTDALKAMKQYNNVPLDGLPMQIEIIGGSDDMNGSRGFSARRVGRPQYQDKDRPVRRGGGGGGGGGQSRGRGRGRGRGGRGDRKIPTEAELDAQLDAYTSKMDVD